MAQLNLKGTYRRVVWIGKKWGFFVVYISIGDGMRRLFGVGVKLNGKFYVRWSK